MAEILGSALAQEAVSRAVSFGLSRGEEKASEGHLTERLEMAVSELEFALERAQELPIRHISLLGRRKQFKSAYMEAVELLDKHKHKQQQAVAHGVKRKRWVICAKDMSITSYASLSMIDVRRFEWYAACAGRFVRDVESGCSLHHYNFCNPIVRHLLEGKTLRYYLKQGNLSRHFYIWPTYSDERGVEAVLRYRYEDSTYFSLVLFLRLSESTDIVGVAIKGLQLLTSEFKLAAQRAMGELTMLSNLQDIAHSYGPPWVGFQEHYINDTQFLLPDPACCKENRHRHCASNNVSSELSDIFPEQVIHWCFECYYVPALEPSRSSCSSFDVVGRSKSRSGGKPPLLLTAVFTPHHAIQMEDSYALEIVADIKEYRDASIQQVVETLKSNAINCFFRQPEPAEYKIFWRSKHGGAGFGVKKASMERTGAPKTRRRYNTRTRKHKETSQEVASQCGVQEYLVGSFVAIYGNTPLFVTCTCLQLEN